MTWRGVCGRPYAWESLDAENARNKVMAATSNQAEQDMIQESHVTALAKTAAADAKATSEARLTHRHAIHLVRLFAHTFVS